MSSFKADKHGILVVVSGFSGAGKGTVMKKLMEKYPDQYALSVSATTRAPREGEQEGVHYFYKSREQFLAMIQEDQLIEYAEYVGNFYGTPKSFVQEKMAAGIDVILEIEMQGARKIKQQMPEAVTVFVTPPSFDDLAERLKGRGTESPEVIEKRLLQAAQEAGCMQEYDYILVNEDGAVDICVEELHGIVEAARDRTVSREALVSRIQKEACEYQTSQMLGKE